MPESGAGLRLRWERFFAWLGVMASFHRFILPTFAACSLIFSGCEGIQEGQQKARVSKATAAMRAQAKAEHEFHRSLAGWKKTTYKNDAMMAQATPENVAIEISLSEQRGLLLVNGAIAMDFPVATGKSTHPTPTGAYHIRAKEKDYFSNLYGKITDATGAVVVADADTRIDKVPEGGKFEGATMPYWMRLTDGGVGLHVGYVPGRPASHGCIRLKNDTAQKLFELTKIGTPVVIAQQAPSLM